MCTLSKLEQQHSHLKLTTGSVWKISGLLFSPYAILHLRLENKCIALSALNEERQPNLSLQANTDPTWGHDVKRWAAKRKSFPNSRQTLSKSIIHIFLLRNCSRKQNYDKCSKTILCVQPNLTFYQKVIFRASLILSEKAFQSLHLSVFFLFVKRSHGKPTEHRASKLHLPNHSSVLISTINLNTVFQAIILTVKQLRLPSIQRLRGKLM